MVELKCHCLLYQDTSLGIYSTLKSWKAFNNFQIIKNLSVEKETLSTVTGFEPEFFDCRSNALFN